MCGGLRNDWAKNHAKNHYRANQADKKLLHFVFLQYQFFPSLEKMGLTTCFQYKTNLKGRSDQRIFIGVDTQ